eukprot:UN06096
MSWEKSAFTCWTKFKGGKFQMHDEKIWNEYNSTNDVVASFEQLNGADYDLNPYEVLLLNKQDKILIKLDKKNNRKSQITSNDENFDVSEIELFRLKWDLIETGFWDSFQNSDQHNKDRR